MLRILLAMDYCKECEGSCCLDMCREENLVNGICIKAYDPLIKEACNRYPIVDDRGEYKLKDCKGIKDQKVPISELEKIINRLNKGENNFFLRVEGLFFKAVPSSTSLTELDRHSTLYVPYW